MFMNLLNTFLHAGVSMQSLARALLLQPVIFAIVMVVEGLLVSKLAQKAMKRFVRAKDSVEAHALARTVCMVTGMSLAMSLIGLVLAGTPLTELPLRFALAWPMNFCAAFWWQMLAAGPIAIAALKIVRTYRSESVLISE
jgi:hypothetical integral membrane protein